MRCTWHVVSYVHNVVMVHVNGVIQGVYSDFWEANGRGGLMRYLIISRMNIDSIITPF